MAPRPAFLTLAAGQMRLWRAGSGPPLVVLPGLATSACDACAEAATRFPQACVTAFEWPGIGGSAALAFATLDDVVALLREAIAAAGLAGAPVVARDLAIVAAQRLGGRMLGIDADVALGWAIDDRRPPDLAPRRDGAHLAALFAHLRDAHLLDPGDARRARREGAMLPDPLALDRAAVAAGVDPAVYARLWALLLAAAQRDGVTASHDDFEPAGAAAAPLPETRAQARIWRRYVDLDGIDVHVRRAGRGRPLIVLQSAPGSSEPLRGVIESLATVRSVHAPDFPGNGDSGKIDGAVDIARLARAMLAVADASGLDSFDLWGTHTGALVALEMAILAPARVGRLVMEAPPLLSSAFSADILANYLPPLVPDRWGLHLMQAWNMRRDMFIFWPWYRAERAAIRPLGLPDAQMLHDWTIGLLKSGATYDRSYRAAFEYDTRARLALLTRPALICAGPADMLVDALREAQGLCGAQVEIAATPATVWYPNQDAAAVDETLAMYRAFLTRED